MSSVVVAGVMDETEQAGTGAMTVNRSVCGGDPGIAVMWILLSLLQFHDGM